MMGQAPEKRERHSVQTDRQGPQDRQDQQVQAHRMSRAKRA